MTKEEIKQALYNGDLIKCTKEEYSLTVRRYIQECAAFFIDHNVHICAKIALNEVRRLDKRFELVEE